MQVIQAVLLVSAVFGSIGAAVPNPNERIPGTTMSNPLVERNMCHTPPGGCSSAPGQGCDEHYDCFCINWECAPPMPINPPPPPPAPPAQSSGNRKTYGGMKTPDSRKKVPDSRKKIPVGTKQTPGGTKKTSGSTKKTPKKVSKVF